MVTMKLFYWKMLWNRFICSLNLYYIDTACSKSNEVWNYEIREWKIKKVGERLFLFHCSFDSYYWAAYYGKRWGILGKKAVRCTNCRKVCPTNILIQAKLLGVKIITEKLRVY